jgi:hypothetical protein
LQTTQPSKIIATANSKLGRNTAILVTNASQKPVTVTTGFIDSSYFARIELLIYIVVSALKSQPNDQKKQYYLAA